MELDCSRTVLYASGVPAAGVSIRVLEKDQSGKSDDNLTLTPGLSDATGHFTARFDTSRYKYLHNIHTEVPIRLPFLVLPATRGGDSDLGNVLLPYLQFSYQFNGQPRIHTAALVVPLQAEFRLPEFPSVQFVPSQHGFKLFRCQRCQAILTFLRLMTCMAAWRVQLPMVGAQIR